MQIFEKWVLYRNALDGSVTVMNGERIFGEWLFLDHKDNVVKQEINDFYIRQVYYRPPFGFVALGSLEDLVARRKHDGDFMEKLKQHYSPGRVDALLEKVFQHY